MTVLLWDVRYKDTNHFECKRQTRIVLRKYEDTRQASEARCYSVMQFTTMITRVSDTDQKQFECRQDDINLA